ncbi:uncharacterized protein LOC119613984 [Lucilia sericata]|uniref:uncharacterized protein LOC119606099 n=1 Tax=Lucilia sericata TaxID=13632 RepID=UPI0018A8788C|nr:uncharacterized protein LOC119606099 [Lucilia sericata]XP_037825989.1 uncharacterized protein LOC119613983 [Lucilia sericata]XP_037825990.1 uncharacterized protein LOC119613984 [Lucilia sericata]
MKLLLVIVLAILSANVKASIIPANPITTTYALPHTPVATSYQVVARNVNRVLVPHVPSVAYPGYASSWGSYPYNYRYGFGYGYPYGHVHNYGYGIGYPYGYGASVW